MFEIKTDCVYGDAIRRFFQAEFPTHSLKTQDDVLELLTAAIVSTGKVRLGPKPSIESLYEIRGHLLTQMERKQPIRFLMPWGSEKPANLETVDLAEVCALRTLSCLQKRVTEVYQPGIHIRVRVEDASAPNLFHENRDQARLNAKVYTNSLTKLVKVLGIERFIELKPESDMTTEAVFESAFDIVYPAMLQYLQESEGISEESEGNSRRELLSSYHKLYGMGWRGTVPTEQREHYRETYRRLYGLNTNDATELLARYLSQSLVRKDLNILGNGDWKNNHLGLSFVAPVPGEPKGRLGRRLYYRTLPESISSLHMPPWRAKGYLAISNDETRPRLASWSEPRQYVQNTVTLTNGDTTVNVRSDYEVL